jgi:predicted Zn-dependent protease
MVAAERMLQQAVAMAPVDPSAYRYLAEVARRLGHTAVATDAAAKYALLASSSL